MKIRGIKCIHVCVCERVYVLKLELKQSCYTCIWNVLLLSLMMSVSKLDSPRFNDVDTIGNLCVFSAMKKKLD